MKPCPFCGSGKVETASEKIQIVEDYSKATYPKRYVVCSRCEARGPISYKDDAAAERQWDDRFVISNG